MKCSVGLVVYPADPYKILERKKQDIDKFDVTHGRLGSDFQAPK